MFKGGKKSILALSILIGTVIGAGIFGIPYAISKSGIVPGFFYFFILGGAIILICLLYGEVILRNKEQHHLPIFAKKYLGNWGRILATVSLFVGLSGVLLVYIILGGDFLKIVFSSLIDLPSFYFSLFFLGFLSYFILRGMKLVAVTEIFTNLGFFLIMVVVFIFAAPKIDFSNFSLVKTENIFLPYGIILFSLIGFTAIPEMGAILRSSEERKLFKKTVILGFILILSLYILFSLTVIGVSGKETTPETLQGLIPFLGPGIIFWGALAAVITLADSFLALALYFKSTLIYDFKFPKFLAFLITCGIPLFLFLIGFRSFIATIGFVGTIVGVIEGILIILIYKKARLSSEREPEYSLNLHPALLYLLITILFMGGVSQFFKF